MGIYPPVAFARLCNAVCARARVLEELLMLSDPPCNYLGPFARMLEQDSRRNIDDLQLGHGVADSGRAATSAV